MTDTVKGLQAELTYKREALYGILYALRDAPQLPSPFILSVLGDTAGKYPKDWERGKQLQRKHGLDAIPPRTECEVGAGLWDRIRKGLTSEEQS